MAREYFERTNSYNKRSSQRSSSLGPATSQMPSRHSREASFEDDRNFQNYPQNQQSRQQRPPDNNYRQEGSRDPNPGSFVQNSTESNRSRGPQNYPRQISNFDQKPVGDYRRENNNGSRYDLESPPDTRRRGPVDIDSRIPVKLPAYQPPPRWLPYDMRTVNSEYELNDAMFQPRNVSLSRRTQSSPFGFHIRGGYNLNCGIFVSVVLKNMPAEKAGLRVMDLIMFVNGEDFHMKNYQDAVAFLRSTNTLHLTVRHFPAGYQTTLVYEKSPDTGRRWVTN